MADTYPPEPHLMEPPAPVSPIATQERDTHWAAEIANRITVRHCAAQTSGVDRLGLIVAIGQALVDERSSAERRIEELGRERDELRAITASDDEHSEADNRVIHRIATENATLKAEVEELKRERRQMQLQIADYCVDAIEAGTVLRTAEARLASLTGQVEDAAREKVVAWMIQHSIATGHGDTLDDLLGELSAYVRKMQAERAPSPTSHRLLADAVVSRDERIASLTGQVEDMRAALQNLRREFVHVVEKATEIMVEDGRDTDPAERTWRPILDRFGIDDLIARSPPVLPYGSRGVAMR